MNESNYFYKYLKYKNKYFYIKKYKNNLNGYIQKGGLLINEKEFTPGTTYILSEPGYIKPDIVVKDTMDILSSLQLDEIGLSKLHPNYWFEITPYPQLYNFKIHTIPFHSDTSTVSTDFILIGKQAQLEKKMNEEFIKNMKETYKLAYSMITSFPSFMDIMMKEYKKEKNKEKVIQIYQKQIQICECIENFAQACVSSKDNLSNFSKVIETLNKAHSLISELKQTSIFDILKLFAGSCMFDVCHAFPSEMLVNFIIKNKAICNNVISLGSGWGILETALSLRDMNVICVDPIDHFSILPTHIMKVSEYDFTSISDNFCIMFPFQELSVGSETCDFTCALIRAIITNKCTLIYAIMDNNSIENSKLSAVGSQDFHLALKQLNLLNIIDNLPSFNDGIGLICCCYNILSDTLNKLKKLFIPEKYPNYQHIFDTRP